MQKKTVYLLQDTNEHNLELAEMFSNDGEFMVIGSSCDGESGLKEIESKNPDVLITEIILRSLDGIGVIENLKKHGCKVKVVVLSVFCREEIISKAIDSGADYFMVKPFNFSALKDRINDLFKSVEVEKERDKGKRPSLDEKISNIFINVGIPPHIKGYCFLREGVKMAVKDPSIINNITKKLYPLIGEKYETSASKVERAIRHAIEVAWNRGRIENINSILGVRAYVGAEKPTNGEFIALVADKMLLDQA